MITLVTGNDWKSSAAFVRARTGAFERLHEGSYVVRVDVENVTFEELIGALSSPQLWGGAQCIVFTRAQENEDFLAYMNEHARGLSESQDVYIVWCDVVQKEIAHHTLLTRFSEIHDFVARATGEVPQQELFAFSDLVTTGKGREALARFHVLTRRGVPAERIFHTLRAHAENLAVVGALTRQGKSQGEITTATKLHPYVVEKCLGQLRIRPTNQRLNEALLRFDMELKKGLVAFPEGFEEILLT